MTKDVKINHNHCPAMLQCDLEVSMRPTYSSNLLVYVSSVCSIHKYMEHQLALLIQSFFAVWPTPSKKDHSWMIIMILELQAHSGLSSSLIWPTCKKTQLRSYQKELIDMFRPIKATAVPAIIWIYCTTVIGRIYPNYGYGYIQVAIWL
jgi:hypothetical protein